MIHAQNIHKSFEGLKVLKGVSLIINKGEIVSIIGASGAGKSTLLQILGTLTKSDKGSLQINNQNIQKFNSKNLSKFRNQEIGFIFQEHQLLPEFSALENVCLPYWIKIGSKKDYYSDNIPKLPLSTDKCKGYTERWNKHKSYFFEKYNDQN